MQTNVASIPMTGLSRPPLASGGPAVPISGFTHPLTEVFHPLPADNHLYNCSIAIPALCHGREPDLLFGFWREL